MQRNPERTSYAYPNVIASALVAVGAAIACGDATESATPTLSTVAVSDSSSVPATTTSPTPGGLPSMYEEFASSVAIRLEGGTVVLETDDVPDHPSPYFPTSSPLYETPSAGMVVNPNRIAAQNLTFRIPASPTTSSARDTNLGPIGVATNGVVFFNQYAGRTPSGFLPLDNEIATFDTYNGHPAPGDQYHYHIEPVWLTQGAPTALVGVLLDGFPVYGPVDEEGTMPTGLDECNGHTHATSHFPDGIYHYHVTTAFPYISGCYRGSPGSFTN